MNLVKLMHTLVGRSGSDTGEPEGTPDGSACPDEAQMLAYAEGRTSTRRRGSLERHFADCDDCLDLLALVARVEPSSGAGADPIQTTDAALRRQTAQIIQYIERDKANGAPAAREARGRSPAIAARGLYLTYKQLALAAMLVCAIVAGAIFYVTRGPAPTDAAIGALALFTQDGRRLAPRLAGGLPYSRFAPTRGGDDAADTFQLDRAFGKLKAAESQSAPPAERAVLARLYLASGDHQKAKKALDILLQVAQAGYVAPETLNDTGVAYFQLDKFEDAIAYFNRALDKSPAFAEALFNKALAEERAKHNDDAARDWRQFIATTSDPDWKREAEEQHPH